MLGETISQYKIQDKLGKGGMGEVYLAQDTKLDRKVALKFLPTEYTKDTDANERFVREAKAAAALNHPNIVTIYEINEFKDQTYIAMEYVQGKTLREKIAKGLIRIDEILRIAVQAAEGLQEAHKEGIVHRDIKSANIMINDKNQVKILDFGLAKLKGTSQLTKETSTLGTIQYMSPEQTLGEEVDHRTDIWSLGVALFEMVTGKLPFIGEYDQAVIYSILNEEPEPITRLRSDAEEGLKQVVDKCLEKNPDQRYQLMEELLVDLRAIRDGIKPSALVAPGKRHTVGRDKELAQLLESFQVVSAGQGVLQCVAGEPGIGKTTLVNEFLNEMISSGRSCTIARGQCSERLAGSEAYLPVMEVLESLIKNRANESMTKMMQDKAPWWYVHVASISADDPANARLLEEAKTATQERVKRELATFLKEISLQRPLVFVFEDLHWADISSIDMLSYLAGRFDSIRLLVIATYRPAELKLAKHPFLQIKPDLLSKGRCRETCLDLLSLDDIKSYLELEFSEHNFPEDFSGLIHKKTEGSPLFMVDLLRDLRNRGVIVEKKGRWLLSQSVADIKLEMPGSVQGMIQRKISQLNEDDRRMLTVAAVQGFEFDSAVVAAVLKLDNELVEERLHELERSLTFVRFMNEKEFPDRSLAIHYQFVHVFYQNELFASLTRTKEARLSKNVAETLLDFYKEQSFTVAAQLAVLFESARDYIRAAHYFCIASYNAAQTFSFQEAIIQAQHGLKLLETLNDSPEKTQHELDLQCILGPVFMAAKGYAAPIVGQTYTRAQQLCHMLGETPQLFQVLFGLSVFNECSGRYSTALEYAEQLLNLAKQVQDEGGILVAHHSMAHPLHFMGEFDSSVAHHKEVLALYNPQKHHHLAFNYGIEPGLMATIYTAWDLWYLGYPDQSQDKIQEALTLSRELSDYFHLTHALTVASGIFYLCQNIAGIRDSAKVSIETSTEYGIPLWAIQGECVVGWMLIQEGNYREGIPKMKQSIENWRGTGMRTALTIMFSMLADAFLKSGQTSEGLAAVKEALIFINESGERFMEAELQRLQGELLLQQDVADNQLIAEKCFGQALEVARRQRAKSLELRVAISLSCLWHNQGKQQEARKMLNEVYGWFKEGFDTGDILRAKALLDEWS
jgi:tetratricopeptide (TPR) repeat protein/predicted Ser/Thr protein kinase